MTQDELDFCKMLHHIGHHISCVPVVTDKDGVVIISIECEDCNETLYDIARPETLRKIML
jgi:hypothetical protein